MALIHYISRVPQCCRRIIVLGISLLLVGGLALPADSYVLKGPHILSLMVKKLAGQKTLQVDQSVMIEDPSIGGQPIELKETLRFIFPDRFRSDMQVDDTRRFFVKSGTHSLTAVDGIITENRSSHFNRYVALFLKNTRYRLHKTLLRYGVDVGVTSLGRMEDHVVFVIGANYPDDSVSQVWVDKERFVPVRWINVIESEDVETEPQRLDFVYRNWQELDGVWYPMQIDTFYNEEPIRQIRVTKVSANGTMADDLFDIGLLETKYQREEISSPENGTPVKDMEEVQQTLDDFRKKFDP